VNILRLALIGAVAATMPAAAMDFSGLVNGGYANISGAGVSADGYTAGGAVLADFGGLNLQGNLDYQKQSLSGVSVKDTGIDGDLFWRGSRFALGGSVRYDDLSTSLPFPSDHVTSYGGFGELYLGPRLTLKGKAGGTSGAFDGSYFGAAAEFYLTRHIALEPVYQYNDMGFLGHANSYGGAAELFISDRLPLAVTGAYSHSTSSGVGVDQFMLSLSWRFGADRGGYVGWDRSGPIRWNGGLDFL
jgi:hypothetical protein